MHAGFPHSDIRGSMLMCSSPRLFAAYRVFHRLPVPGHPPCALLCLTSLYHPHSPSGSLGRSKIGSYTPPQANLRCVSFMFFSLACYCFLDLADLSTAHPSVLLVCFPYDFVADPRCTPVQLRSAPCPLKNTLRNPNSSLVSSSFSCH